MATMKRVIGLPSLWGSPHFQVACGCASIARRRDRVSAMPTTPGGSADGKTVVVLGTATPGGGFPVYGAAVADTVHETDPTLAIEPRNTKGSTENVPLLEAGQLDIALVQGEVAHEAFSGIGRPPAKLTIVAAMYSTPGMFVVRADTPYRRVEDLRGKPVGFGAKGSGLVILSRYVLDGVGLDQDRDFQGGYLDRAGDGPAMVLDGRTAALWGGGHRRRPPLPPRARHLALGCTSGAASHRDLFESRAASGFLIRRRRRAGRDRRASGRSESTWRRSRFGVASRG